MGRKKTVTKPPLLQLLELCTEKQPQDEIKPWMRKMDELVAALQKLNVAKNRPAAQVELPPNWCDDGVYKSEFDGVDITCTHRALGITRAVPNDRAALIEDKDGLYIESNWSTRSALLCEPGKLGGFPLIALFPEADKVMASLSPSAASEKVGKRPRRSDSDSASPAKCARAETPEPRQKLELPLALPVGLAAEENLNSIGQKWRISGKQKLPGDSAASGGNRLVKAGHDAGAAQATAVKAVKVKQEHEFSPPPPSA